MTDAAQPLAPRDIHFGSAGIDGVAAGTALLARLARAAFGPGGGPVLLERPFDSPLHVTDAERICREVELDAALPDIGVRLVREVQLRTRRAAGDGGAAATILFDALLQDGLRLLAGGTEPRALARGLRGAADAAAAWLQDRSRPVRGPRARRALAHCVAGDAALGDLLADAVAAVGPQGAILVEAGHGSHSELVPIPGFRLQAGYASPLMAADTLRLQTRLERPDILVAACTLSRADEVVPLLERMRAAGRPLLLVAEGVEGAALATLAANSVRQKPGAVAVALPGHGANRRAVLEDLAAATGARPVETPGGGLPDACLGRATEALVGRESSLVRGGRPDRFRLRQRLAEIGTARAGWPTEHEREQLDRRQANLTGRAALLRIGGATDPAAGAALHRAEVAARGFKAGLHGGVLPGGGSAYVAAAAALRSLAPAEGGERRGWEMLCRALVRPSRVLLANAGIGDAQAAAILERYGAGGGRSVFDLRSGIWQRGRVLDSAAALRAALDVAAGMAALLLTANVVITERREG